MVPRSPPVAVAMTPFRRLFHLLTEDDGSNENITSQSRNAVTMMAKNCGDISPITVSCTKTVNSDKSMFILIGVRK